MIWQIKWVETIGISLEKIEGQAVGETLVLLTSFALVLQFKEIFKDTLLAERMLYQDGQTPFASSFNKFHENSAAGQRPVWLSLGNAWTSVNYSGQSLEIPAEQDNILSDLVIPRVPFCKFLSI